MKLISGESKPAIDRLTVYHTEMMGLKIPRTAYLFPALYLLALLLSHAWRGVSLPERYARPGQETAVVSSGHGEEGDETVLGYLDLRPPGRADPPTVVLLHGSPMAGETFVALAPHLARSFRVLIPDLLGFGGSTRRIPDYSIRAQANYLEQWIRDLGIPSVHLVGYSLGGGVALEWYRQAMNRVRSVTLLSSVGVQELELLGDYHLNRVVHGLQLVLLTLLQEGTPHFGALDNTLLNVAYARSFFDSDQRPLRGILEGLKPPLLILHGRSDRFVPVAAAKEHHRIAPHSTLRLWDGGHALLFTRADAVAGPIGRFIQAAEAGAARTRSEAAEDRLQAAAAPFDWRQAPSLKGIGLVLVLLLLALATYVSEDLTCIAAGLLVARDLVGFVPAAAACLAGIFSGDLLLYAVGACLGRPLLRKAPFRWFIHDEALSRSEQWFRYRGPMVILLSRFLPGARLPTYVAAGVLNMPLVKFSGYFLLAALVWTPVLVGSAALVGERALPYVEAYQAYSLQIASALALALWLALKIALPMSTFRGRRLLLSAWRRMTRWEFWPPWVFYPPVVLYIVYLGIRFRGFTVFTAANPSMPAGGFIGESKHDILHGLADTGDVVARFARIPVGEGLTTRVQCVAGFMERLGLTYPVVLKPDAGQRGQGVTIARSEIAVRDYLAAADRPVLVQEFVPGREFGVFYVRLPDRATGRIFAITDKRPPVVWGDGENTLEELILRDDRAVCMAPFYSARHARRLYEVIPRGQEVVLTELGTHCLGCVFHDGMWVHTPALERAFDRISRSYPGFYFGRYDVRTPSVDDFRQGTHFKILELNGVTSEATNIYDPSNSLWTAYGILFRQWRLAFEIGHRNRLTGTRPTSLAELAALVLAAPRAASPTPSEPLVREPLRVEEDGML